MCGEEVSNLAGQVLSEGSPPRVRGRGVCIILCHVNPGITPACAGKSLFPFVRRHGEEDHPRVCGEELSLKSCWGASTGSPPRVRGRAGLLGHDDKPDGITPACAGKSLCGLKSAACGQDHPRVCGEETPGSNRLQKARGSPPRVRGREDENTAGLLQFRITPACAGKSWTWRLPGRQSADHPRVCGEES